MGGTAPRVAWPQGLGAALTHRGGVLDEHGKALPHIGPHGIHAVGFRGGGAHVADGLPHARARTAAGDGDFHEIFSFNRRIRLDADQVFGSAGAFQLGEGSANLARIEDQLVAD